MRAKRFTDIVLSIMLLVVLSPVLVMALFLVWISDFGAPIYAAERIGKDGLRFRMFKIRTMVVDADKSSVVSTAKADRRITPIGRLIRSTKLDEVMQFINVLFGSMSLVGPRPNTWRTGVEHYTSVEQRLLSVAPGITDFSSIVFSDEADILEGSADPDLAYNQLIRPWKSRLGLIYIDHQSFSLDMKLIFWTTMNVVSRRSALKVVSTCLEKIGAPRDVIQICRREHKLVPAPPPGNSNIATHLS